MGELRYFLVSYSHPRGFGRMFFGTTDPVDSRRVEKWESLCGKNMIDGPALILSISEIDGPIEDAVLEDTR